MRRLIAMYIPTYTYEYTTRSLLTVLELRYQFLQRRLDAAVEIGVISATRLRVRR